MVGQLNDGVGPGTGKLGGGGPGESEYRSELGTGGAELLTVSKPTTYKAAGLAELLQGIPAGTEISDSLGGLGADDLLILGERRVVDGAELVDEFLAKTPVVLVGEVGDFLLHSIKTN